MKATGEDSLIRDENQGHVIGLCRNWTRNVTSGHWIANQVVPVLYQTIIDIHPIILEFNLRDRRKQFVLEMNFYAHIKCCELYHDNLSSWNSYSPLAIGIVRIKVRKSRRGYGSRL